MKRKIKESQEEKDEKRDKRNQELNEKSCGDVDADDKKG